MLELYKHYLNPKKLKGTLSSSKIIYHYFRNGSYFSESFAVGLRTCDSLQPPEQILLIEMESLGKSCAKAVGLARTWAYLARRMRGKVVALLTGRPRIKIIHMFNTTKNHWARRIPPKWEGTRGHRCQCRSLSKNLESRGWYIAICVILPEIRVM